MDLNYLYHRHGVSLAMAERAACGASREAHLEACSRLRRSHRQGALRQFERRKMTPMSREDAADGLRDQAASCRRLAKRARTNSGADALEVVADQFDTDASRIDPRSLRR